MDGSYQENVNQIQECLNPAGDFQVAGKADKKLSELFAAVVEELS